MADDDILKTPKKDTRSEQERVTEAYENISKKLEALRSGKDDDKAEEETRNKETEGQRIKKKDDDEIDPLDKEDSEEIEGQEKKGQSDDEEEDELDDVKESDEEEGAPKETLAERGEELKEEAEEEIRDKETESKETKEKDNDDEADKRVSKWSSFKADPADESPTSLDDLADTDEKDEASTRRFNEEEAAKAESEYQQRIALGNLGSREERLEDESPDIPRIKPSFAPNMPINEKRGRDPFSDFNPPTSNRMGDSFSPPPKSGASKKHVLFLVILGLLVIGATVFLLQNQFSNPFSSNPSPSPSEVAEVTSTPEPTLPPIDRSKYKIRVLNGTTKTGLAASVSAKLKGLGYQDDKTANATNSAFQRTVVRTKSNLTDLLNELIKDLAPEFDATSSTPLKDSDSVDAEVILGTK